MSTELTAKEIKEGITQGKWCVDGYDMRAIISETGNERHSLYQHVLNCNYGHEKPEQFAQLNMINAEAIVRMQNSTYGKGLDPEKMEELWIALDNAMNYLGEIDHGQYSEWKQLLESARIK